MYRRVVDKINYQDGSGYQLGNLIQFNGMLHRPTKLRVSNWWSSFSSTHSELLARYNFWITGNFIAKGFSTWDIDIVLTPKSDNYVDEFSNDVILAGLKDDLQTIIQSSFAQPEPFLVDVFYSNNWEPWPDGLSHQQFESYADETLTGFTIINEVSQHGTITHDYANMSPAPELIIQDLFKRTTTRLSAKHILKYQNEGKFWEDPILMNTQAPSPGVIKPDKIPIISKNKFTDNAKFMGNTTSINKNQGKVKHVKSK